MLTESSLASTWAMSQAAIGTRQCVRPREPSAHPARRGPRGAGPCPLYPRDNRGPGDRIPQCRCGSVAHRRWRAGPHKF